MSDLPKMSIEGVGGYKGQNNTQVGSSNMIPGEWVEYLARFASKVGNGSLTNPRSRFLGAVIKETLDFLDADEEGTHVTDDLTSQEMLDDFIECMTEMKINRDCDAYWEQFNDVPEGQWDNEPEHDMDGT